MKNTLKKDYYLYEQVETVLRDSIPKISKNIHESLFDRVKLFTKEKVNALAARLLDRMSQSAGKLNADKRDEHQRTHLRALGRELSMKPEHIDIILNDYPKTHPSPPQQMVTTTIIGASGTQNKVSVQNPNYDAELERYDDDVKKHRERSKLEARIQGVLASNPFIASTHRGYINAINLHKQNKSTYRRMAANARARVRAARIERIAKGYIK